MQQIPFRIRPIDLGGKDPIHLEPISLPNDLSGKVTISSKYLPFHWKKLQRQFGQRILAKFFSKNGADEIILETNTILKLARTKELPTADDQKNIGWFPFVLGSFSVSEDFFFSSR